VDERSHQRESPFVGASMRPTAHATDVGDSNLDTAPLERVSEPQMPLYAVVDRRASGEPRTVIECRDPLDAQLAVALLRSQGADAWLEIVPQPIP
jgi:hypothetical protein